MRASLSTADEISFNVHKYEDGVLSPLWDRVTDLQLVFVREWRTYFEITVQIDETDETVKKVTGQSLCESELGQIILYDLELNTESDILRDDYKKPSVFYDADDPKNSMLHRILEKAPHYTIAHVDNHLQTLVRSFSANETSIYDFLTSIVAEELNCLFVFDSTQRSISVYDLENYCVDCMDRIGQAETCPVCGGSDIVRGYGEDTTIFVAAENLSDSLSRASDPASVKNCFRLEAGDDYMTATIANINPNGTRYIYRFSPEQKALMPSELVEKLEAYDQLYQSKQEPYSNVIYKAEDERALYQWDVNTSTYEQLVFLPSFADTNTTYKLELDPVDVHKIILYARDIGEEDWCNVGEIETADTVYDDQELRSAVENVSMLVGKTPVAEQISSAIRALSVPDEAVAGQFITTVAQSDGKVAVSRRALQESDVPALGMGKVNGLQDALDLKATTASVTAVDKKVTQLSGTVGTVQGSVTTLVGNDANKSVRTIANEELAAQLIPEGATEALDTLQEIAAWIQHHPNDAAALNSSIAALQAQLNGIETGNGTVKSYVDTAVQDLAQQVNQDIQEIELTPGPQGPPGADGQTGATGPTGADGQDGVSPTVTTETISGGTRVTITDASGAHEFDVMNGQNGAPGADGQDGQNGQDGITPTIGENGNWFLGDTDTGKPSRGEIGLTGPVGPEGPPGAQGEPGKDGVQIDDTAVSGTETWSSRKIIDTLCPEFSVSGNPVTCTPVEGYPLDAVVTLEPKQAGTGDPSPDNVRPITGRDRVKVTVSNESESRDYDLTLPETIYGGSVDTATGAVQSTYAVLRAEDFTTWGIVDFPNVRTYRSTAMPDDADDRDAKLPVLCDKLAPSDATTFAGQAAGSILRFGRVLSIAVEKDSTPEDIAARYGAISVAYTLKTPRTLISTGAQPVSALPGKNTLLTDGDSLTVTGRTDPLAAAQAMMARIAALEQNAIGG